MRASGAAPNKACSSGMLSFLLSLHLAPDDLVWQSQQLGFLAGNHRVAGITLPPEDILAQACPEVAVVVDTSRRQWITIELQQLASEAGTHIADSLEVAVWQQNATREVQPEELQGIFAAQVDERHRSIHGRNDGIIPLPRDRDLASVDQHGETGVLDRVAGPTGEQEIEPIEGQIGVQRSRPHVLDRGTDGVLTVTTRLRLATHRTQHIPNRTDDTRSGSLPVLIGRAYAGFIVADLDESFVCRRQGSLHVWWQHFIRQPAHYPSAQPVGNTCTSRSRSARSSSLRPSSSAFSSNSASRSSRLTPSSERVGTWPKPSLA